MNHWALFKQSWSILWRNPGLWLIALLPALVGFGLTLIAQLGSTPPSVDFSRDPELLLRALQQSFNFAGPSLIIGVIVQLVVAAVTAFAEGALINMVDARASGRSVSVAGGMAAASNRLVPLVIARLLLTLPIAVIGALVGASALSSFAGLLSNPRDVAGAFAGSVAGWSGILFALGLLIGAITLGADRAIMLEGMSALPAIARGWRLLWSKFADYFTIGLIFFVLSIVVGVVFACAMVPIFFAALAPTLAQIEPGTNVFVGAATAPFLIFALLFAFLGMLVTVFVSSVWTLAYRHWLAARPSESSIGTSG
jgi:hypothetical protein